MSFTKKYSYIFKAINIFVSLYSRNQKKKKKKYCAKKVINQNSSDQTRIFSRNFRHILECWLNTLWRHYNQPDFFVCAVWWSQKKRFFLCIRIFFFWLKTKIKLDFFWWLNPISKTTKTESKWVSEWEKQRICENVKRIWSGKFYK